MELKAVGDTDSKAAGLDATGPLTPWRVLVVDDTPTVRRLVALWLRHAGYTVMEAADGMDAIECFRREPVQVVISDIGMPRVGGLQLLAALRNQEVPPEVILLTGSHGSDAQAAVQALRLGAHDYLVKDATAADALRIAVQGAAEKWRLRQENARLLRELRHLSVTDPLTGLGNRRALDDSLQHEVARARRHGSELSLILLDLDRFKRINDTLGHATGDEVLVSFSRRLREIARECDLLFRHGGEEFSLVLGNTPLQGATALAQRIVEATAAVPVATARGRVAVTCSAGVAGLPADDPSAAALMKRADAALYEAKRTGRNRVSVAGGAPQTSLSFTSTADLEGFPATA